MKYNNAIYIYGAFDKEITSIRVNLCDTEDVTFIPIDQNNAMYAEIMKLVEENKLTIIPAEESPK